MIDMVVLRGCFKLGAVSHRKLVDRQLLVENGQMYFS